MIDVQHRSLRPFEKHAPSGFHGVVDQLSRVADHGTKALRELQILIANFLVVDGLLYVEGLRQQLLVLCQGGGHSAEPLSLVEIGDTNAPSSGLIFITGANAARSS